MVWFDKRKCPGTINLDSLQGCILNVPNDWKVGWVTLPFNRKHWIAFKKIRGSWYNLDSKMKSPEEIGDEEAFNKYLKEEIKTGSRELFLVMS